jgi:hypothetical protein
VGGGGRGVQADPAAGCCYCCCCCGGGGGRGPAVCAAGGGLGQQLDGGERRCRASLAAQPERGAAATGSPGRGASEPAALMRACKVGIGFGAGSRARAGGARHERPGCVAWLGFAGGMAKLASILNAIVLK